MSYSSNPLLPKARADAVRLVVEDHLPVSVAADDQLNIVELNNKRFRQLAGQLIHIQTVFIPYSLKRLLPVRVLCGGALSMDTF